MKKGKKSIVEVQFTEKKNSLVDRDDWVEKVKEEVEDKSNILLC